MRLRPPAAAFAVAAALVAPAPSAARQQDDAPAASAATVDGRVAPAPAGAPFALGIALGVHDGGANINRVLAEVNATGARWVRVDISWAGVQWRARSSFAWAPYDAVVNAAHAHGLHVLGNVAYSPGWARPRGASDKFAPNTRKRRVAFARFAAAAAARYRGRVRAWEIWNEPNNPGFWQPRPNALSYAALVRAAYRAIKRRAPHSTVLAGATAPARTARGWIDEVTFLRRFYRAGGRRHFDAWSHHPYDFNLPPGARHKDSAWWQTYGARPSIRSVMAAHGDRRKKVWATEYGVPSAGYPALSEAVQALWLRKALTRWRAFAWGGPVFNYMIRDGFVPNVASYWYHIGLVRSDWTRKPAFDVVRQAAAP